MSPETALVLAAALGSGGVAVVLVDKIVQYLATLPSIRAEKGVMDAAQISDELQALKSILNADVALLLYTSNGERIMSGGSSLTVTIAQELVENGVGRIKPDFQGVPIDDAYLQMLRELIKENVVFYGDPQTMADGFLKKLYLRDRVKSGIIVRIPVIARKRGLSGLAAIFGGAFNGRKDRFHFISLRWIDSTPPPLITVQTRCAAAAHRIAPLIHY